MIVKKRPIKLFAIFLSAMLAMTFVSREIYTKKLAVVTAKNVQHMRLVKNIKASGTLEATAVKSVYLPDGLTVEKITVSVGSSVSNGDELFKLDMAQLKEKASRLEDEINELITEEGLQCDDETPVFIEPDIPVKSVEVKPGDKVSEGDILFTLDCDKLLLLINDLETERNEDIINLTGSLAKENKELEEDNGLPNTEAEILELNIQKKQKKIDRYLGLYNNGGKVTAPCSGRVTKVKVKTGELTDQSAALLIGSDIKTSSAAADKKEQLKMLKDLIDQHGAVKSPADGIVTEQTLRAGEQTGSGAAVCIADENSPMIFSADISEEDAKNISVGDSADLSFHGGRIMIPGCRIASVTKSENVFRLNVPIENREINCGETGQLTISAVSEEASDCVPNSAVKGSTTDRCIYVLRIEDGFLGKEYHAERLSVNTGLSNESFTAIDDTGLSEEDKVICTDRELTDGQTVRVKE
ncbi:HlyD family efflux transporter periplasmic adaptor subunit [Ruminococcus sp.]|uniref:efflux RND transporter periplasmic adaptor subunit n=1 Tax=Ruminococcus sp. TaxID=41978 RepID=UPI002589ADEB|nr:HlyD family efflux transporter periplasmic adaptor subunit [Ruminococcus sp.]MCR5020092.1 hypothetical protein [Ruminococcus sp.]